MGYGRNTSLRDIHAIIGGILIKEEWMNIPNYESAYKGSNFGRIKSLERVDRFKKRIRERILKQCIDKEGYYHGSLFKNGNKKNIKVSTLIALCFIENKQNKPTVNHKRGIKEDNMSWELEWATYSEQNIHRYRVLKHASPIGMKNKIGSKHHLSKKVLCITNGEEYGSAREAARNTGVHQVNVSEVCRGKITQCKGFVFKYL